MALILKSELGAKLHDEVINLVTDMNNAEGFRNFDKNKLDKVEEVYLKYNGKTNVRLLNVFLSMHSMNTKQNNVFNNNHRKKDVTFSYGYTELVADK